MESNGKSISELLIEQLLDMPDWMEKGACVDADVMPLDPDDMPKMLDLCNSCPVLEQCREKFSQLHEENRELKSGVFGGESYYPAKKSK